ncbi:hypothetical protein SAMN05192533_10127 [Mesobacillus persicus]|uniref:Coat F domain-containing protein n=1 Tax=Mesobacillus persicus TaxID=930146 RepID=A0A1H7VMM6_9BACI|nr:rubrerythrin family protein [Mesobacillus persicus]SEM10493.1 hypothetical protein SAMN05192533_10127 [Mesobacillus persicus]
MDNTQQAPMQTPPQVITTKDMLYLKDALSWELLALKKFHHLAQQVSDQEMKQALDNAGRMHQNHYQRLLAHLQTNNDATMANVPSPNQNQNQNQQH